MTLFPSQFVQFQVVVALIVLVMFSLNVLFVVDLLLNHHTRSKLHTHTHAHTHTPYTNAHTRHIHRSKFRERCVFVAIDVVSTSAFAFLLFFSPSKVMPERVVRVVRGCGVGGRWGSTL